MDNKLMYLILTLSTLTKATTTDDHRLTSLTHTTTTWTTQHPHAKSLQHRVADDLRPTCHQLPCETRNTSWTLDIPAIISLASPYMFNFTLNESSWCPRLVFLDDKNNDKACVDMTLQRGTILLQAKYKCDGYVDESKTVPFAMYYTTKWLHFQVVLSDGCLKISSQFWKDVVKLRLCEVLATRVRVYNVNFFGYSSLAHYKDINLLTHMQQLLLINSSVVAA
ncbi:hypothetical protein OTU49_012192, partial [Cherax quadricarinatus]